MAEIAKYHPITVITVIDIVMSPWPFRLIQRSRGRLFSSAIFLLILANRLLWQANRLLFDASPFCAAGRRDVLPPRLTRGVGAKSQKIG